MNTVHDTTNAAKDKASEVGSQVQDKAKGQLDTRSTQAGDQLQDKAEGLHQVGDQLRDSGQDTFAQLADRVAGWTEDAARYLRNSDADSLLGDVEDYARRQPWAVAAGGLVLGFAASRVVRAGSEKRQSSSSSSGRYSAQGYNAPGSIDLTDQYGSAGNAAGTGYGTGTGYTSAGTGLPTGYEPLGSEVPDNDPLQAPSTPGSYTDGNR